MALASRRFILQRALFGVACACAAVGAAAAQTPAPAPGQKYMCPPCGCAADGKRFDAPGACPDCGMPLIPAPADGPKADAPAPPKLAAAKPPAAKPKAAKALAAKPLLA